MLPEAIPPFMDNHSNLEESYKIRQKRLSRATYNLFNPFANHYHFFALIALLLTIAFFITDYPEYARWFGFLIAAYGTITNDSIQTLGLFITANAHRTAWYVMWLFIALVFLFTVGISWHMYDRDVSYQRLDTANFPSDASIKFSQLVAPVILLVITRFGVPVSTTFLLMSTFVEQRGTTTAIIRKSVTAYIVAFMIAFALWGIYLARKKNKSKTSKKLASTWVLLQWLSSGVLWAAWLMQDGTNMSIFLPRQLDPLRFIAFVLTIFGLLGLLFSTKGGKMQQIVKSKTGVTNIRAAFNVNLLYSILLIGFTLWNRIPMSTTWMFIGLLGGRELASGIWLRKNPAVRKKMMKKSLFLILRDLTQAAIGLVVSLLLSAFVNHAL